MNRQEIMAHIGEMLDHGFETFVGLGSAVWVQKLARFAKDYVQNGTHGTEADRTEAMLTLRRKLYGKLTGNDPDASEHHMNNHWLPEAEDND